jgi:hypothetical protein
MMFSNLGKEFTSDVALQVAQRNVTTPSTIIVDCEPAVAGTDQARLESKYRFVFFTVIVGTLTDGNHEVTAETSTSAAGPFTPLIARTGPLTANSTQVLVVRRDKTKTTTQRFVRLVHNVTGAAATGAVVGGVIQRPKVVASPDIDLEQVLRQCMYAVGAGAGMPIHAQALERVCLHVRDGFFSGLNKPGKSAPAEWNNVKHFLMACCEEIGRQAAADAHSRALIAIPFRVDDPVTGNIIGGLAKAYNDVSTNNDTSGGAGEYCPSNVGN